MRETNEACEPRGTGKYERLLARCKGIEPVSAAVAHPCDEAALGAVVEAAVAEIISPILVGPAERIRRTAKNFDLDIEPYQIEDAPHSHAAAARAVDLVRLGRAGVLMKRTRMASCAIAALYGHAHRTRVAAGA